MATRTKTPRWRKLDPPAPGTPDGSSSKMSKPNAQTSVDNTAGPRPPYQAASVTAAKRSGVGVWDKWESSRYVSPSARTETRKLEPYLTLGEGTAATLRRKRFQGSCRSAPWSLSATDSDAGALPTGRLSLPRWRKAEGPVGRWYRNRDATCLIEASCPWSLSTGWR